MLEKIEKLQLLCVGVIFSLALIITGNVVTKSLRNNVITVTGSASEIVKSDEGSLDFDINVKAPNKKLAYTELKRQLIILKKYLKDKEINDIDIKTISGYYEYKRNPRTGEDMGIIDHYDMTQPVVIKSNNVELIKEISTDISELINQGIDINRIDVSYNYTKLADIKVKLLEKASQDAKDRAKSMLKPTGSHVGGVQSVKMGVYQITSTDSTEVSDVGINDTSSIDKKITAVSNVTFKIK